MTARRTKFRWSDEEIVRALGDHAITDPVDEQIVRELAVFGASQILARRDGGRRPKASSARGEIRRIVISGIFEGQSSFVNVLPPRLRKTPSAPPTVRKVREILVQCGFEVREGTVLNDMKKIGIRKLRGSRPR